MAVTAAFTSIFYSVTILRTLDDELMMVSETPISTHNLMVACFEDNSAGWLQGPRHGNLQDPLMQDNYGERMILRLGHMLESARDVLEQSLCHKDSRLLQMESSNTSIRMWTVRLVYLAVYYHQHQPALAEARLQSQESGCEKARSDHDLSTYDYECPSTKYLAVSLWNNGIGANMEHVAIPTLKAGLALNRTVIFVSKASEGPNWIIKHPWSLASCSRRDPQCFFAPLTPCVPAVADLAKARSLKKNEKAQLFATGSLPAKYEHDRVVYMLALHKYNDNSLGGKLKPALQTISRTIIDQLPPSDPRNDILRKAVEAIMESDGPRPGYDFQGATSKIHHAMVFYAMRPNLSYQQRIDQILADVLPSTFVPDEAIGLPIRASDKCLRESECLTFEQHVMVASRVWAKVATGSTDSMRDASIVFTTESTAMQEAQRLLAGNASAHSKFPAFRFVTNSHDVTPDSGRFSDVAKNVSADEAMLSAISSLKLQLMSRVSVGNCCSNYHRMLHDYLSEGCGAASDSHFHCLQEDPDPELRVCCFKAKSCIQKREQEIAERALMGNTTLRV